MTQRYTVPSEVDIERLRKLAARRREVLTAGGCATYTTGVRDGVEAIVCLCCGLGSINAQDVAQRYCGFCQAFHSEWVWERGKANPTTDEAA